MIIIGGRILSDNITLNFYRGYLQKEGILDLGIIENFNNIDTLDVDDMKDLFGYHFVDENSYKGMANIWKALLNSKIFKLKYYPERHIYVYDDYLENTLVTIASEWNIETEWNKAIPHNFNKGHVLNNNKFIYKSSEYDSLTTVLIDDVQYGIDRLPATPGIYCIKQNDEIIYIGKSERNIQKRCIKHIDNFLQQSDELFLYRECKNYNNISFDVMCLYDDLKAHSRGFSHYDLSYIEYFLIRQYKPKYNVAGISSLYLLKV